jgi:hypothetical protein
MATGTGLKGFCVLAGALVAGVLYATPSNAHFHLDKPDDLVVQATNGDPQKPANATDKCPAGTASNKVTQAKAGAKLTVQITETVPHGGHYRVSFAANEAALPNFPATTVANNQCPATTTISNPPVFPILADGLFPHTQAQADAKNFCNGTATCSTDVTIPANTAPGNYVLQVIEWMTPHGSAANNGAYGCFYAHCATVQIVDADASIPDGGVVVVDGGSSGSSGASSGSSGDPDGDDAGSSGGATSSGSSGPSGNRNLRSGAGDDGCNVGWGGASGVSLFVSIGLGLLAIARRRRR